MLVCPKCSYSNELGRIFCHQCGNKLDLSQIKAPGQGGPKIKRKKGSGAWKTVRVLAELVFLLAVIFVFFLAWQVPLPPGGEPSDQDVMSVDNKRMQLETLVNRTRPGKLIVTANEVNAFLSELKMEKPPDSWLGFLPEKVWFELGDGTVKVRVWGDLRFGDVAKKQLYVSYTVIPAVEDGELEFRPVAGRIGQLPLHLFVLEHVPVVQRYIGGIFAGLKRDQENLSKLTSITVTSETVTLQRESKGTTATPPR
jgi:hypothetical protein